MARIDVTSIVMDPDFVDPIVILRNSETIGENGRNTVTGIEVNAFASVQTPNSETLKRLPESARLNDVKTFYTKTPIFVDSKGGYADVIKWKGGHYQVINVMPWDNWGAGWYKVDAQFERASK